MVLQCLMEPISRQLLYQRLRNRVIELLDTYSSVEDIAKLGAFEMINLVDDLLPLDYDEAPKVFSETEKEVIAEFLEFADAASDATDKDTWNVDWFRNSREWVILSEYAKQALAVFAERGRFSEEREAVLMT